MSVTGLLLGVINIAIVIAVLILVGYIAMWIFGMIGFAIPATVQKIFMAIVALTALYLIVQLVLGAVPIRLVGAAPPLFATG